MLQCAGREMSRRAMPHILASLVLDALLVWTGVRERDAVRIVGKH